MSTPTFGSVVLSPLEYVRQSLVDAVSSLIGAYQRRISPQKGFSCAYRVSRGRLSCSAFGKRALLKAGLVLLIPLLLRRFRKCSRAAAAAAAALKEERGRRRPLYERAGCKWENCANVGCDGGSEALAQGACEGGNCLGEALCSGI